MLVVLVPFALIAQARTGESNRVRIELDSKLMGRKMPYEVVLPPDYESDRRQYASVYLLHGLTGKYSDWLDKSKLMEHAQSYEIIFVMPEGANGWYTDSPVAPNDKYESYISKELIQDVEARFRVRTDRGSRVIAGLSMGGYGAIKFGLKHPDNFVLVGSFSGALRAAEWDLSTVPNFRVLGDSVSRAFGPQGSQTRKENNIFGFLNAASPDAVKKFPFIYLDCGTEDFLIGQNREFTELLMRKKIPHEFRQLPGGHDWRFWDSQVQEFLRVAERFLKTEPAVLTKSAGGK